ncbi:MAG TPA: T9SS type A sorting domain-containing protein [Puia sp.]|nr:T9SS type A sorting domain-containing protein [Puia sp.]
MKIIFYKNIVCILGLLLFFLTNSNAQNSSLQTTIQKAEPGQIKSQLQKRIDQHNRFRNNMHFRHSQSKQKENALSVPLNNNSANENKNNSKVCPPQLETNFAGNPLTPFYLPPIGYYASESSIAISNAGKIVSISNGWICYYDENGRLIFSDSLYHFCSGLIDVRVVYDPKKDRFVFVSSYGFTDFNAVFDSEGLVVAFSKSNNPMDGWNFYYYPDSEVGDNNSIDYPQLGISDNDVFVTEFRTDADGNIVNSIILQLDKHAGYSGASSIKMQTFSVQLSGDYYASVVPASGGSTTYGPNMYFVMADETGSSDDLYYVFEVTNTIASGKAVLKTYGPVHSGETYFPAPISYQPGHIPLLEQGTEDGGAGYDDFLQNAFFENGIIQFSQNSAEKGNATVCIGKITGVPGHLSCKAQTISDPHLDLLFPQIIYSGNAHNDNSAIVGIEYTGEKKYPGLEAVSVDNHFSVSQPTTVKQGEDTINGLWGDYSALCRRYNHPGECWIEGQYGSKIFPNINWIAKLESRQCYLASEDVLQEEKNIISHDKIISVFPNPLSHSTTISFSLEQPQKVSVSIFDLSGRLVSKIADANMEDGLHQLIWDAKDTRGNSVLKGIYFIKVETQHGTEIRKIIVM